MCEKAVLLCGWGVGESCLLRGGVAHEAEAPGLLVGVPHDLGGGDGAVRGELCAQLVVVHVICQVLDVQVHALVLGNLLLASVVVPETSKHNQRADIAVLEGCP